VDTVFPHTRALRVQTQEIFVAPVPVAMNPSVGISGMAVYLPPHRVDLERWCEWTGIDPD
jgi:hypothetical protein